MFTIDNPDLKTIGTAELASSQLCAALEGPVDGKMPVTSLSDKKVGDVQISLRFERADPKQFAAAAAAEDNGRNGDGAAAAVLQNTKEPDSTRRATPAEQLDYPVRGANDSPFKPPAPTVFRNRRPGAVAAAVAAAAAAADTVAAATSPRAKPSAGRAVGFADAAALGLGNVNDTAAAVGGEPFGVDLLMSLLSRGEKLRDQMTLSAYDVGDHATSAPYTAADNGMATGDGAGPAAFGSWGSAGAGSNVGTVATDDSILDSIDPNPGLATHEAAWVLNSFDSNMSGMPLPEDALLEDLFYGDGAHAADLGLVEDGNSSISIGGGGGGDRKVHFRSPNGSDAAVATSHGGSSFGERLDQLLTTARITVEHFARSNDAAAANFEDDLSNPDAVFVVQTDLPRALQRSVGLAPAVRATSTRFDGTVAEIHHTEDISLDPTVLSDAIRSWATTEMIFTVLVQAPDSSFRVGGFAVLKVADLLADTATRGVHHSADLAVIAESTTAGRAITPIGHLRVAVSLSSETITSSLATDGVLLPEEEPSVLSSAVGAGAGAAPEVAESLGVPLHLAMHISHAKEVRRRPTDGRAPNLYLACRSMNRLEQSQSEVHWGQTNPRFLHHHAVPVLRSADLLMQLKKGVAVVEVWDRCASPDGRDELVGLVKIPLHAFYLAYFNVEVAAALLGNASPVIACNGYRPIVNLYTGKPVGELHMVLAMGSRQQVAQFPRSGTTAAGSVSANGSSSASRAGGGYGSADIDSDGYATTVTASEMDGGGHVADDGTTTSGSGLEDGTARKHTFEVTVVSTADLSIFEETLNGEADCFVQYHFPETPAAAAVVDSNGTVKIDATSNVLERKALQTPTVVCVPNATFDAHADHCITLPSHISVTGELAHSLPEGLDFELWQRLYYPTVCDKLIGKATLPLAELTALLSAPRLQAMGDFEPKPVEKLWELPIAKYHEFTDDACGTLTVSVKHREKRLELVGARGEAAGDDVAAGQAAAAASGANGATADPHRRIGVKIVRATGLQAAVDALAATNASVAFALNVGVNTYCRAYIGDISRAAASTWKTTSIIPRSFAPEYNHSFELGCDGDTLVVELWHRAAPSMQRPGGAPLSPSSASAGAETLLALADVRVPSLWHAAGDENRTPGKFGGWYPLHLPHNPDDPQHSLHSATWREVGAIELAFEGLSSHPIPFPSLRPLGSVAALTRRQLTIGVDEIYIPASEHRLTDREGLLRLYVKYTVLGTTHTSTPRAVGLSSSMSVCAIQHVTHHDVDLDDGSADLKVLCRGQLEVKLFTAYATPTGSVADERYFGSSYLDVLPLFDGETLVASDVCTVIKAGVASLCSARIKVRASLSLDEAAVGSAGTVPTPSAAAASVHMAGEGNQYQVYSPNLDNAPQSTHVVAAAAAAASLLPLHVDRGTAYITVERALHLPTVYDPTSDVLGGQSPSTYVSYQIDAGGEVECTNIVESSSNPVWSHRRCVHLALCDSVGKPNTVIFKLWHAFPAQQGGGGGGGSGGGGQAAEKLVGLAVIDLKPLLDGLKEISGWYHWVDFKGVTQGQVKLHIVPVTLGNIVRPAAAAYIASAATTPGATLAGAHAGTAQPDLPMRFSDGLSQFGGGNSTVSVSVTGSGSGSGSGSAVEPLSQADGNIGPANAADPISGTQQQQQQHMSKEALSRKLQDDLQQLDALKDRMMQHLQSPADQPWPDESCNADRPRTIDRATSAASFAGVFREASPEVDETAALPSSSSHEARLGTAVDGALADEVAIAGNFENPNFSDASSNATYDVAPYDEPVSHEANDPSSGTIADGLSGVSAAVMSAGIPFGSSSSGGGGGGGGGGISASQSFAEYSSRQERDASARNLADPSSLPRPLSPSPARSAGGGAGAGVVPAPATIADSVEQSFMGANEMRSAMGSMREALAQAAKDLGINSTTFLPPDRLPATPPSAEMGRIRDIFAGQNNIGRD